MSKRCQVRNASAADAAYIDEHLRASDVMETEAAGVRSSPALLSFEASRYCRTMVDGDGTPFAILGVSDVSNREGVGCVWLLGTDGIDDHKVFFGKTCARELKAMVGMYGVMVCNCVHDANEKSKRWLGRLGANFAKEPVMGFRFFYFMNGG